MGAGSSVDILPPPHIHISLPNRHENVKDFVAAMVARLKEIGFTVTQTDPSLTTEQTCKVIRNAHGVIMCISQASSSCVVQAVEYSYIMDNYKKHYNVILDPYEDSRFTNYIQGFLQNSGIEISSVDDVSRVINEINKNHVIPGLELPPMNDSLVV